MNQLENKDSQLLPPQETALDIFDFSFIRSAPVTEKSQPVENVIKVYHGEWSMERAPAVAIDVENKEIYIEPRMANRGVRAHGGTKVIEDAEKVIQILEKYDIQNWQHYYSNVKDTTSYEDGASWSLWLQYDDGSVEIFRGEGTFWKDITPDNYQSFVNELTEFVEERIDHD